ncbi:MAG: DapH/DapD/GlmU-related protein [Candidatus Bathyarchaeia archaeon]
MSKSRIDPTARVSGDAEIGEGCHIGPEVRIVGHARLEKNVWLDSYVTILGEVVIGKASYVGSGCIIGHPKRQEIMRITGEMVGADVGGHSVIGKRCIVRSGSVIYTDFVSGDDVEMGHDVLLREGVSVGDGSMIGSKVVIDGETIVGRGVSIQTGAYICRASKIEDFVFIGPNCVFTNDKYAMQKEVKLKGPTIKMGASIGANSTLMPGIVVGEGSIIGAQAIVTRDVPPGTVYVGVPARRLRRVPKDWTPILRTRYKERRVGGD